MPGDRAVAASVVPDREVAGPPDRGVGGERDPGGDRVGVDLDPVRGQFGADFIQEGIVGSVDAGPDRALGRVARVFELDAAVVADGLVVVGLGGVDRPVVDAQEVLEVDMSGVAQRHPNEVVVVVGRRDEFERAVRRGVAVGDLRSGYLDRQPVPAALPQLDVHAAQWLDHPTVIAEVLAFVGGVLPRGGRRRQRAAQK